MSMPSVTTNVIVKIPYLFLLVMLSVSGSFAQEKEVPGPGSIIESSASRVVEMPEAPANPPKVECGGGQLTISANNSTLENVLSEVRRCLAIEIDVPASAAGRRLFDQLGPGPARQILTSLLSATGFDYVVGASSSDPSRVATVLLMVRSKDATTTASMDRNTSPARRAWMQMRQNSRPSGAPTADASADSTNEQEAVPADEPPPMPTESTLPASQPAAAGDAAAAPALPVTPGAPPESAAPASPVGVSPASAPANSTADKIANMQQMFEQRRQMQTQNPSPQQ